VDVGAGVDSNIRFGLERGPGSLVLSPNPGGCVDVGAGVDSNTRFGLERGPGSFRETNIESCQLQVWPVWATSRDERSSGSLIEIKNRMAENTSQPNTKRTIFIAMDRCRIA
jgi:hypothetical protein